MVQLNIYYSVRKADDNLPTLKFFVDEECAKLDQEHFKFWEKSCHGFFGLDIKGTAYIDQVVTKEEYIEELENMTNPPTDLIKQLKR